MPAVVFIEPNGSRRTVAAAEGVTVMEAARQNGIRGVIARCGGACACATCHVYIGAAWLAKLEPPEDMELGMLESAWEPRTNSRLSCQIQLTPGLEGLEVAVPERQGDGSPTAGRVVRSLSE
jgi:2Fe-2S ferredoxin